jgi:adenylate cyclase
MNRSGSSLGYGSSGSSTPPSASSLQTSAMSQTSMGRAQAEDARIAQELVRTRRIRGSYIVSLAAMLVCLLSLPFCIYVGLRFNHQLGIALTGVSLAVASYEALMLLLFRRQRHRPFLDWINVSLEVSIVSAVVALDAHFVGPAYAFTSAPMLLYAPVILLSALRLSRTLTLYAGTLAAVELLAIYLRFQDRLDQTVLALVPSLTLANFVQRSCYLLVTGLLAAWLCATFNNVIKDLVETVRKEVRARNTLGRHVSREVARHLLDHSQDGGDKRSVSVMFCDLRDFTSFSETLDPRDVLNFLNQYFALANRIIEQHGGVINKFMGDGIMALFGATSFMPQREHARRAAQAALALSAAIVELRQSWNWSDLRIGIGIHTGLAVVGIVGSADRVEFTAIGDTVNLASRIESLCKSYGVPLLLSGPTAALLEESQCRRLGEAIVKGRKAPIEIFELLPSGPAVTAAPRVAAP